MKKRIQCDVCKRKTRHNQKGQCINHVTNRDGKEFPKVQT